MSSFDNKALISYINEKVVQEVRIMEVCGTHTQAIARANLSGILNPKIQLISGPGCPVCVTSEGYIDAAIELLEQPDTIISTFGDMVRVRGSCKSLEDCMAMKDRVKIVYSPFATLDIAECNPRKNIIFLAVGFETTAPLIAALAKLSLKRKIKNLFFLVGLKLMPPVLQRVLSLKDSRLDALICPGHVSVIMGSDYFNFVRDKYNTPAAICGFEYNDVITAIYHLLAAVQKDEISLKNLYTRCVRSHGNINAKLLMSEVFHSKEGYWRGIGAIEQSELAFNNEFLTLDAAKHFGIEIASTLSDVTGCQCGDIITGSKSPYQCRLFDKACNPEEPKGPCMVSTEGACAIYYKYKRGVLV